MSEWYCPTCGGPNELVAGQISHQCHFCRMRLGPAAIICPACGQVWPEELDDCPQCAEPLSTVGRIFHRHETAGGPPPWLERNRQQAQQIKMAALSHSEARMEEYLTVEQARLNSIRQSEEQQRANDRQLFLYLLAAAVVVLIILLAIGLAVAFS